MPHSVQYPPVRRPALTLVLLSCLTFTVALGRPAVTDSDEAFYAEAAREMVESGDWLTPHFNYADRWEKPALYYWLTAALYRVAGPEEWAARGWAALSGVGLVLLSWAVGRRAVASAEAAWLAGAIVATSYGYFAMARAALPDLPLACCVTATVWAAFRAIDTPEPRARLRWWIGAGIAAGLGFLTKGPVGLAVPAVVLLPAWWRERHQAQVRWSELFAAGAACAVIGLPWYAAMTMEHGTAYLESFFLSDNLARFATDRFNEPRPPWFYVPVLLGGLMPWTAFLLMLGPEVADLLRRRLTLTREQWRLLLWAVMPLLLFTLSIGKQPRYILPVLPPLALLLAGSLVRRVKDASAGSRTACRLLATAVWATAGLHLLLAMVLLRAQVLFPDVPENAARAAALGLIAGGVALAATAARRAWNSLRLVMPGAAALLLLGVFFGVLSGARPEPVERMATGVAAARTAGEPVGVYGVFVRNLVFYTGTAQVPLYDEEQAITFLRSAERVLLVARARDLPRLERLSGVSVRALDEIRYLDTAALRLDALLWPLPAQDVETVRLVTNR